MPNGTGPSSWPTRYTGQRPSNRSCTASRRCTGRVGARGALIAPHPSPHGPLLCSGPIPSVVCPPRPSPVLCLGVPLSVGWRRPFLRTAQPSAPCVQSLAGPRLCWRGGPAPYRPGHRFPPASPGVMAASPARRLAPLGRGGGLPPVVGLAASFPPALYLGAAVILLWRSGGQLRPPFGASGHLGLPGCPPRRGSSRAFFVGGAAGFFVGLFLSAAAGFPPAGVSSGGGSRLASVALGPRCLGLLRCALARCCCGCRGALPPAYSRLPPPAGGALRARCLRLGASPRPFGPPRFCPFFWTEQP